MYLNELFCSCLILINQLQNFLIPCPFKKLTGFDCPGCGFQRSLIALFKGNINKSLHLYPATIPILIIAILGLAEWKRPLVKPYIKRALYSVTAIIVIASYLIKMTVLF